MFSGFSKSRRLLFVGLIIALFGAGLYVVGVRVWRPLMIAAGIDDDEEIAEDIQVSGTPNFQKLTVAGQIVLERSGSHLGKPRISPDGTLMAITVVPTGTETIGLAEIYLIERATGRVLRRIPGHNPRWQTGRSNQLRFDRLEANTTRTAVYDTDRELIIGEDFAPQDDNTISPQVEINALTYPSTIRVAHHPENNCRNVPDWQVDTIPFEEYVARSVPAEVPISWPAEALAAQAVATRTYAWYQILRGRRYYDVTDWANFQMMCNWRFTSTDAAVNKTTGQYLAYKNDSAHSPIIAMYSAKNSHPTLTNTAVPYLQAVPDETGLGEARWGHGYGLSQWGAVRRAKEGQTYRQILGHYYTDVTLQNARQPDDPIGGFIGLPLSGYLPAGGLRWDALVPAAPLPGTVNLQPGASSLPIRGVWLRGSEPTNGGSLTATLTINSHLQESVSLQADWEAPDSPTFTAPSTVEVSRADLTIATPEQGARIGLSNNWIWQGESLYRTTGDNVNDATAEDGLTRQGRAGVHSSGWWYGPYATGIPHDATYRALFRLRMGEPAGASDNVLPDQPIARLDVADKGGTVRLGLRDIWPSDFAATGQYVDIPVDFHLFESVQGLEFRVQWYGETDLDLDRIQLWQLQTISSGRVEWPLAHSGTSTVSAIAFDSARNASPVVTRQIEFGSEQPPVFGALENLQGWWTRLPILISVLVQDYSSGLNKDSGQLLLDGQPTTASFSRPNEPQAEQKLSASLTDVADGTYSVRFQATDQSGLQGESETGQLRVDRTAPTVEAEAVQEDESPVESEEEGEESGTEGSPSTRGGIFSGPVKIIIEADDATSGVWGVAYVLNDGPVVIYDEPFYISKKGLHAIRYWAKDNAGNYSTSHRLSIWVRNIEASALSERIFIPTVMGE